MRGQLADKAVQVTQVLRAVGYRLGLRGIHPALLNRRVVHCPDMHRVVHDVVADRRKVGARLVRSSLRSFNGVNAGGIYPGGVGNTEGLDEPAVLEVAPSSLGFWL